MLNVYRKLTIQDNVPFDCILSFKTDNYIGIYCHTLSQWLLADSSNNEFHPELLDNVSSIDELDDLVYEVCGEHIESVSESNYYTLTIVDY